jgi:hypothetical protein
MVYRAAAVIIISSALCSAQAWGQSTAQQPCPPSSGGVQAGEPPNAQKPENQPMEKSAVLPDAEQHEQSAASTVQQNNTPVEAQTDCPKPPNQLNNK